MANNIDNHFFRDAMHLAGICATQIAQEQPGLQVQVRPERTGLLFRFAPVDPRADDAWKAGFYARHLFETVRNSHSTIKPLSALSVREEGKHHVWAVFVE